MFRSERRVMFAFRLAAATPGLNHVPASESPPHAIGVPLSVAGKMQGDPINELPHTWFRVQHPFDVVFIAAGRSGQCGSATAGTSHSTLNIVLWMPQVLFAASTQQGWNNRFPMQIALPHDTTAGAPPEPLRPELPPPPLSPLLPPLPLAPRPLAPPTPPPDPLPPDPLLLPPASAPAEPPPPFLLPPQPIVASAPDVSTRIPKSHLFIALLPLRSGDRAAIRACSRAPAAGRASNQSSMRRSECEILFTEITTLRSHATTVHRTKQVDCGVAPAEFYSTRAFAIRRIFGVRSRRWGTHACESTLTSRRCNRRFRAAVRRMSSRWGSSAAARTERPCNRGGSCRPRPLCLSRGAGLD